MNNADRNIVANGTADDLRSLLVAAGGCFIGIQSLLFTVEVQNEYKPASG